MEYEVTQVPSATYAVIEQAVPMDQASGVIPRLIGQVHDWVEQFGFHGAPVTISSRTPDGGLNLKVGWPLSVDATPPAPIERLTLPASRALVHVHVGPYDALPSVYDRLWEEMQRAGLRPGGDPRESYETPPEEDPPVTRIVWPLEPD